MKIAIFTTLLAAASTSLAAAIPRQSSAAFAGSTPTPEHKKALVPRGLDFVGTMKCFGKGEQAWYLDREKPPEITGKWPKDMSTWVPCDGKPNPFKEPAPDERLDADGNVVADAGGN